MKRYLYISLVFIWALLVMSCGQYNGPYGPMGGGWGHMMNYGYGYGGMFMWILFIIVIGVVAYFIVQSIGARTAGTGRHETPLDILKKRYAKGEITKKEYDKMKSDL